MEKEKAGGIRESMQNRKTGRWGRVTEQQFLIRTEIREAKQSAKIAEYVT